MEKPFGMVGRRCCTHRVGCVPFPIIGQPDRIQELLATTALIGGFESQDIVECDTSDPTFEQVPRRQSRR